VPSRINKTSDVCPFCVNARNLDAASFVGNTRVAGATPMFDWLGDGGTVFSY
jgi:hypothetical protein